MFDFTSDEDGIANLEIEDIESNSETYSRVELVGFRTKYRQACQKRLDVIASKIIEHCLSYFVLQTCPRIIIRDETDTFDLNKIYATDIDASATVEKFKVGVCDFELKHIKIFSSEALPHRIHWCAHKREVIAKKIEKIPNLTKRLFDGEREFSYSAYVSGIYLDSNVNPERTNFYGFGSDADNLAAGDITWKELSDFVHQSIENYLSEYLAPIREQKLEKVRS